MHSPPKGSDHFGLIFRGMTSGSALGRRATATAPIQFPMSRYVKRSKS